MHALRRNVDIKILLFNNKIYGLTKGQFSPTSEIGTVTKSSPGGTVAPPFSAPFLALGAQATFVARSIDTDAQHLQKMITRMAQHKGTALLEIFQNCPIFNDGAFEAVKDRARKSDEVVEMEQGQPLVYGAKRDRVIKLDTRSQTLYSTQLGETDGGIDLVHDEQAQSPVIASLLAQHPRPGMPIPIGVFRAVEGPVFDQETRRQQEAAIATKGPGTIQELLEGAGDRWKLE